MRYRLIIASHAFDKLGDVLTYIAQDSPANAAKTIDRLLSAMRTLDDAAFRFTRVGTDRDGHPVYRYVCDRHNIYYAIDDRRRVVTVLDVVHSSQRQPKRFN
jgi:plasmid stabilization system protein ParE